MLEVAVRKGTAPKIVAAGSYFENPPKQDSFSGMSSHMPIADSFQRPVRRANHADTSDAAPHRFDLG